MPALVSIYNHYVANTHVTFDTEAYTVDSRRAWFDSFSDTGPYRLYAAVVDDQTVGILYEGGETALLVFEKFRIGEILKE